MTRAYWVHLVHTAALGVEPCHPRGDPEPAVCTGLGGFGPGKAQSPSAEGVACLPGLVPSPRPFLNHCPPAWANPHLSRTFNFEVIADSHVV